MTEANGTLAKIQSELKAPKGQTNTFGKYKYRNCEDILEALKPLLDGSTVTLSDDIQLVGDRVYVKATATLTDKAGVSVSVTAFAREAQSKKGMDEAQVTGAASSYARKYALNGLFMIDDTKDADSADNSASNSAKVRPTVQDLEWIAAIRADPDAINQIVDPAYKAQIKEFMK